MLISIRRIIHTDIVYALYDENGALIGAAKDSMETDACSGGSFEKRLVSDAAPKTVRLFIWDSVSGMTPLSYSIAQEIQG